MNHERTRGTENTVTARYAKRLSDTVTGGIRKIWMDTMSQGGKSNAVQ